MAGEGDDDDPLVPVDEDDFVWKAREDDPARAGQGERAGERGSVLDERMKACRDPVGGMPETSSGPRPLLLVAGDGCRGLPGRLGMDLGGPR